MSGVADHLRGRGVAFEEIPHTKTYTSVAEAQALGIAADEVLKGIVVKTASGYTLAAIPGARRLDMGLVRRAVDDHHARLATEEELERDFPAYELGALPPVGSILGLPAYVDPEVLEHETIVFAAGTQTGSVKVRTAELFRDEPISVVPLTRHPEEEDREALRR
jgi:Ala-tRNA(Pro) deacylase